MRLYLALGGVVLMAAAIWLRLTRRECPESGTPMGHDTSR